VRAPANDYLFSYNWLLSRRTEEVAILLNNDMRVDPGFLEPLLRPFEESDTFAVTGQVRDWEGRKTTSGPCLFGRHWGWFFAPYEVSRQQLSYTLFCGGGCSAFDRRKFLELGGFDRLFWPTYGDDMDLGYRAWSRGWKSYYEPASVLCHRESATMGEASSPGMIRALFLFQWRNLRQPWFRFLHGLYIPWLALQKARQGDRAWLEGWRMARQRWKQEKRNALKNRPPNLSLRWLGQTMGRSVAIGTQGN